MNLQENLNHPTPYLMEQIMSANSKILHVDDAPDILELLGAMIREHFPNEILTAATVKAGVEILQSTKGIDLVITDYDMPEADGLDLIKQIRALGMSIPVILITASPDIYKEAAKRAVKPTAIFTKPIIGPEIIHAIRSYI